MRPKLAPNLTNISLCEIQQIHGDKSVKSAGFQLEAGIPVGICGFPGIPRIRRLVARAVVLLESPVTGLVTARGLKKP